MYKRDDKGSFVTSDWKRESLSLTNAETKNFSCFYHKVCILRIFCTATNKFELVGLFEIKAYLGRF